MHGVLNLDEIKKLIVQFDKLRDEFNERKIATVTDKANMCKWSINQS